MQIVYLLLGSNLGSKEKNMYVARKEIQHKIGNITKTSTIYNSKPWGYVSDNNFVNQAIKVETTLAAELLLISIKEIEYKLGRKQKAGTDYEDRLIDIDIIFYNSDIINTKMLQIPHSKMTERDFVLIPLAEVIEKEFLHPVNKKTVSKLMEEL